MARAKRDAEEAVAVEGAAAVLPDAAAWRQLMTATEASCAEHNVGAAIVSIGLRPRPTERRRALSALHPLLRPTDAIGFLADDEVSLLLAPVEDIVDTRKFVHAIDQALKEAGLTVAVGWAMRRKGHDLFEAAARADAALSSARARAIDLD